MSPLLRADRAQVPAHRRRFPRPPESPEFSADPPPRRRFRRRRPPAAARPIAPILRRCRPSPARWHVRPHRGHDVPAGPRPRPASNCEAIRIGPSLSRSLAQASARRASSLPATTWSGSRCSTGIACFGAGDLLQRRLRTTAGEARRRSADRRLGSRALGAFDLTCREATSARASPSPMPDAPTETRWSSATLPMVSRSRSNTASAIAAPMPLPAKIGKPRADRIRSARDVGESDERRSWSGSGAPAPAPDWNRASD